jgi:hypothetical protein
MQQQSKTVQARLKFKSDMPLKSLRLLQDKYGFVYFSRKVGDWVMYEKYKGPMTKPKNISFDDLTEGDVTELTNRVNRIVDCFQDPDANTYLIRARCTNMARTLEPKRRAWVLDWLERNFPDENGPPWENGEVPKFLEHKIHEG